MTTDLSLATVDTTTTPPSTDTSRLSWATSLFYFGMLAGLYPMTFILQAFHVGRTLGTVVVIWGAICMLTAAVTSYQGLYAQRFFLGFVESIVPTGFMCIISGYYTQQEQSIRQSWWMSGALWAGFAGGGLNYGFAQVEGQALRGWQYLYILAGALTVVFGIVCFAIPSSPVTAWFLTPDERVAAVERLRLGQTGVRGTTFKWAQISESLRDVKVWLIFVMMASAYTVNGAITGFGPLIITTFGWSTREAILLQFASAGTGLIFVLANGYLGSRFKDIRIILYVMSALPVIAGSIIIWKSTWTYHAAAPIAGYSMVGGFFAATVSMLITIAMSNVAGQTKKSFTAATSFVAYCVGNIIGPQMVKSQTKDQHYPELWIGLIICYCITITSSVVLYAVLWRANRAREAVAVDEQERAKLAFQDLTDLENPYFRYVL